MTHRKTFLYLPANNDPNHPNAIIGITRGSISNPNPNNQISASIKTDPMFMPTTIPIAVCKTITPLPTRASSNNETALLLCKILTSHTPVSMDFSLVLVIRVTRPWILAVLYLAMSSILSSAYKNNAIPSKNSRRCVEVTQLNHDVMIYKVTKNKSATTICITMIITSGVICIAYCCYK